MSTSKHPLPRRIAALSLLVVLPLASLAGCGESSGGGTPAASAPASSTPAASTQASTSSTTSAPPTRTQQSSASSRQAAAKARKREAFQSLANATPAPKLTAAQRAGRPAADIELQSPTNRGGRLSAENTCHGADRSPALRWSHIPAGTAEIVVLALGVAPVAGKLLYDWALAGIPPSVHEITAGQLPQGAISGRNGYGGTGYKLCPSGHETYLFAIYAVPTSLHPSPGFEPAALRAQAAHVARHTGVLIATYP